MDKQFEEFGKAVLKWFAGNHEGLDSDVWDDLTTLMIRNDLAEEIGYDPDIHKDVYLEDIEKGNDIIYWGDALEYLNESHTEKGGSR